MMMLSLRHHCSRGPQTKAWRLSRVYLKAGRRQKSQPVTVILPAILECVHMHIHCLKVNMDGCFQDFSTCCKC